MLLMAFWEVSNTSSWVRGWFRMPAAMFVETGIEQGLLQQLGHGALVAGE